MADILAIEQLEVYTKIGVYDWEKKITQKLVLDIQFTINTKQIAEEDNLNHALDYTTIVSGIIDFFARHQFNLIETAAEKVAAWLKEEFNIAELTLRLAKPGAIAQAKTVVVQIKR